MSLSPMVSHVSSWGQWPKKIVDTGLYFVTWVYMFPFDDYSFFSL